MAPSIVVRALMSELSIAMPQKTKEPFIDLDDPDEECLKWAQENIGEDPNTQLQLIEELRDMIYERGECVPPKTDDAFLLKFLRARHFIVKMAHRLFVNYCLFKENTPEFFKNVDFNRIVELGYEDVISVPPYLDQDGRRLLILRLGKWDPNKYTTTELFQALCLILEVASLEPRFQVLGGQCIFDCEDLSVNQAYQMSPTIAKQILQVAFKALPCRVQAIHVINHSWVFDIGFSFVKPFLTDMMKQRVVFHNDVESLQKYFNTKNLPKRYGGIHEDYRYNSWLNMLKGNDKVFDELESLGYEGTREFVESIKLYGTR